MKLKLTFARQKSFNNPLSKIRGSTLYTAINKFKLRRKFLMVYL